MPQKLNKAGNMQNYVPAGNGDASGEYGDNASGSNKHFTNFAKPQQPTTQTPTSTPTTQPKQPQQPTQDNKKDENNVEKYKKALEENQEKIEDILKNKVDITSKDIKFYKINLKDSRYGGGIIEISASEYYDSSSKGYLYLTDEETPHFIDENAKKEYFDSLFNVYENNFNLLKNEEDLSDEKLLKLIPNSYYGKSSFLLNSGLRNSIQRRIFELKYKNDMDNFKEKVEKLVNPLRKKMGDEIIKNINKIKGNHSIEDDLKNSNPKYNENKAYRINCQRCSYVYELRRRGLDVSASPNNDNFGITGKWEEQMIYKEKHLINKKTNIGAKKEVIDIVKNAGDGARFAIGVDWKRGRCGHCFICENVGGNVKFLDAQTGKNDCEDYFKDAKGSGIELLRMDNADFSGLVSKTFSK